MAQKPNTQTQPNLGTPGGKDQNNTIRGGDLRNQPGNPTIKDRDTEGNRGGKKGGRGGVRSGNDRDEGGAGNN